jgi:hypothetical protein
LHGQQFILSKRHTRYGGVVPRYVRRIGLKLPWQKQFRVGEKLSSVQ